MSDSQTAHEQLINALMDAALYDHQVSEFEYIETHISSIILTGEYAYKLKKPLDLGFLDFSTLEKRKFYCEEELRLNRRLVPGIYLDVVTIYGSNEKPNLTGEGEVVDYMVKMRQFPQQAQLDKLLDAGKLASRHLDAIATTVARFHEQIEVASETDSYGDPEHVLQPVVENFEQIEGSVKNASDIQELSELKRWSYDQYDHLYNVIAQRKHDGFVRECHGDMHLRNLAWHQDEPLVFDCIEFNPNLRWVDVVSEIAFLVMDLQDRDQPAFAQRFLDHYLQHTGDYAGLQLLPFYLVYRAMVRAKVGAIRLGQSHLSDEDKHEAKCEMHDYLALALRYTRQSKPVLVMMRGMSASGKSTISQQLLEDLPAIRIRSDVERKRLFGLQANEDAGAAINSGIYDPDATDRTYDKLHELAGQVLRAGYSVIVDATFGPAERRKPFAQLADAHGCPFVILDLTAQPVTLRQRIRKRAHDVSDARLEVLEKQLSQWMPVEDSEQANTLTVNTEQPLKIREITSQINSIHATQETGG